MFLVDSRSLYRITLTIKQRYLSKDRDYNSTLMEIEPLEMLLAYTLGIQDEATQVEDFKYLVRDELRDIITEQRGFNRAVMNGSEGNEH